MTIMQGRLIAANSNARIPQPSQTDKPAPWYDPDGLLQGTLTARPGHPADAAEDTLLAWLLRLPDELDPAEAAESALRAFAPAGRRLNEDARRLTVLLEETRRYPRQRLARVATRRRRRQRDG